jgi:hypothetical protein
VTRGAALAVARFAWAMLLSHLGREVSGVAALPCWRQGIRRCHVQGQIARFLSNAPRAPPTQRSSSDLFRRTQPSAGEKRWGGSNTGQLDVTLERRVAFPSQGREYAARWVLGTLGTSPKASKPEDDICGTVAARQKRCVARSEARPSMRAHERAMLRDQTPRGAGACEWQRCRRGA